MPLIALDAGAPFGAITVDADRCTMCPACAGSCPEGALADNPEKLELPLCREQVRAMRAMPEDLPERAITLVPRLNLVAEAKKPVVLNAAEIL